MIMGAKVLLSRRDVADNRVQAPMILGLAGGGGAEG